MKITEDHWVEGARRDVLAGGNVMPVRRFLVIHHTSGMSGQSSIDYWRTPAARGASAHIVIDRDGTVIQCRAFNKTCGHAGESQWTDPRTKRTYHGLNACSIGIELANAGNDITDGKAFGRHVCPAGVMVSRHKNGGPAQSWERYPAAQMQACMELSVALVNRYNLDDVIGHEDIAPRRKVDPGPAFDMAALRVHCGFPPEIPRL